MCPNARVAECALGNPCDHHVSGSRRWRRYWCDLPCFFGPRSAWDDHWLNCPPTLDHSELEFPASFRQGGPCAADGPISVIGGLLPIALCGRTSLQSLRHASHFSFASSRLMNQCAARHSARSFPLKDSMNALSVGLPREVERDAARVAHRSRSRDTNSVP